MDLSLSFIFMKTLMKLRIYDNDRTGLHNSLINIPEFIRAFILDLHICIFQEDPIKTEGLMVMTRSEIGIFSSQDS